MTPSLQVAEAAQSFWDDADLPEAYPRDLRRAIALTQPISIILMPELQISRVRAWLRRQGCASDIIVDDRPLSACLFAHSGIGFIFVDGSDHEREQRYSIAHELAHFLLDYRAPRQDAVARLGQDILDVLDGLRPPCVEERAVALLTGTRARTHVHLLGRAEEEAAAAAIDFAEARADALALELLAPWADVTMQIAKHSIGVDRDDIVRLLADRYGLPIVPARRYAARLHPRRWAGSALLRHLRGRPGSTPESFPNAVPGSSGGPR